MPFDILWTELEAHKRFSGRVSGEEYVCSVQDVRNDERFPALKLIINDFSGASAINIERLAMMYAASLTSAVRDRNPVVRVAFVLPDGPVCADLREILAPVVVPLYRYAVFGTVDEARVWA